MEAEQRKSPARWLAPLAIVAVALVTVTVVSGSSVDDESAKEATATSRVDEPELDAEGKTTTSEETDGAEKAYVVEAGDTLSSIAAEHGLNVDELEALNPDIDPQALAEGQRLKLR